MRNESINGDFQLRLIACPLFFGVVLRIAFAFVLPPRDDRKAMRLTYPVAGAQDEVIALLIAVILFMIGKADRVKDQMI